MIKALSSNEIQDALRNTAQWGLQEGKLVRLFKFKDFKSAIAFVNQVAAAAEAADHHPDILVSYNRVTLELSTHDAGGISDRDFALANEVNRFAD